MFANTEDKEEMQIYHVKGEKQADQAEIRSDLSTEFKETWTRC